jgi:putative toxin-antitoxin system antitoxin component (TIGR02293 family)
MGSTADVVHILGGARAIGARGNDEESLLRRIRKGLPYSSYEHVARLLSISLQEMGDVLDIPKSTRVRRKQKLLKQAESDRLVRVATVLAHAHRALGSTEDAATWMRRPNRALGGETPLGLLDTEIGEQLVEDVLGRLEHGVIG